MRWRNYFGYVISNGTPELRERPAAYLGDGWNSFRAGREQLTSVRLYSVRRHSWRAEPIRLRIAICESGNWHWYRSGLGP